MEITGEMKIASRKCFNKGIFFIAMKHFLETSGARIRFDSPLKLNVNENLSIKKLPPFLGRDAK